MPPRPSATLLLPGVPIPANGSIIIQQLGPAFSAADAKLMDPNGGTPIDGTVRMVGQYAVWTPTRALVPGVTYTLSIATPGSVVGAVQYQLMVVPAWTPARVSVTNTPRLERAYNAGTTRCCTAVTGVSKGSVGCFLAEQRSVVRLWTQLTSTATPTELSQFLFRLSPAGMTPAVPANYVPLSALAQVATDWTTAASEYCVNLDALEITAGKTYDYPNLMTRCVPHGGLGTLGIEDVAIDAAKALGREICPVPPPNYEMRWCETNKAACTAERSLVGCENYGHMCLGEPAPQPAAAGTGGTLKAGAGGSLAAGSGTAAGRAAAGSSANTGGTGAAGKTALPLPPAVTGGSGGAAGDKPTEPTPAASSGGSGAPAAGGSAASETPGAMRVRSGCSVAAGSGAAPNAIVGSLLLVASMLRRRRTRRAPTR